MANRQTKTKLRNSHLREIDRKNRIARKQEEKAYAKVGSNIRERMAAYFMRKGRLTRVQRQVLAFIEGRWTPKGHTKEDEKQRQQLRIPAKIIMEANRFQGKKVEGKRQSSIRRFLDGIISPLVA